MPFLIQSNDYVERPWCAGTGGAWCAGADWGQSVPHEYRLNLLGHSSNGYCGSSSTYVQIPWAWADAFKTALLHQFSYSAVSIQRSQFFISIPVAAVYPEQFTAVIANSLKLAQQYLGIFNRVSVLQEQYLGIFSASKVLPEQYSASIGNNGAIGNQYLQNIDTTKTYPSQYLGVFSRDKVVSKSFLISIGSGGLVREQETGVFNRAVAVGTEYDLIVITLAPVASQFNVRVSNTRAVPSQYLQTIDTNANGTSPKYRTQYQAVIARNQSLLNQAQIFIGKEGNIQLEFRPVIGTSSPTRHSYQYQSPYIYSEGGYCSGPYACQYWPWLNTVYARTVFHQYSTAISSNTAGTNAVLNTQYDLVSSATIQRYKSQWFTNARREKLINSQYNYYNVPNLYQDSLALRSQYRIAGLGRIKHQWRVSLYNTTQLRILWEFASDGIVYDNVLASSAATGDFGAINIKSDIVEKVWRTTGRTFEYFQVDVGEGLTRLFDTIAIINHNLTTSAVVKVYGYGTTYDLPPSNWSTVPLYAQIPMPAGGGEENLIWVSPTQPINQFRHWRVTIEDPSNPAGFLQIGRFVGGAALIFQNENFEARFQYAERNFKDEVQLNGFTGVANNRAVKKYLKIKLPNINAIGKQNFSQVRRYFRYSRDTLKGLVIPDPLNPYLFTVFAKLTEVPQLDMDYIDGQNIYADINLNFDEAR